MSSPDMGNALVPQLPNPPRKGSAEFARAEFSKAAIGYAASQKIDLGAHLQLWRNTQMRWRFHPGDRDSRSGLPDSFYDFLEKFYGKDGIEVSQMDFKCTANDPTREIRRGYYTASLVFEVLDTKARSVYGREYSWAIISGKVDGALDGILEIPLTDRLMAGAQRFELRELGKFKEGAERPIMIRDSLHRMPVKAGVIGGLARYLDLIAGHSNSLEDGRSVFEQDMMAPPRASSRRLWQRIVDRVRSVSPSSELPIKAPKFAFSFQDKGFARPNDPED